MPQLGVAESGAPKSPHDRTDELESGVGNASEFGTPSLVQSVVESGAD